MANNPATDFWLVDQNPFNLPPPPAWWVKLVLDYDKMLRLMPSQRDHAYRLCRRVRREARLGLRDVVIHDHPDTRACVKFGVVPVMTLKPEAIHSPLIRATLQSRDLWGIHGGDPNKIVDAMERAEEAKQAAEDAEMDAWQDEVLTDSYRHVRAGYRTQVEVRATDRPLQPLPTLPTELPAALASRLQNRVPSPVPPTGRPAAGS
jgi:hypothetical protein